MLGQRGKARDVERGRNQKCERKSNMMSIALALWPDHHQPGNCLITRHSPRLQVLQPLCVCCASTFSSHMLVWSQLRVNHIPTADEQKLKAKICVYVFVSAYGPLSIMFCAHLMHARAGACARGRVALCAAAGYKIKGWALATALRVGRQKVYNSMNDWCMGTKPHAFLFKTRRQESQRQYILHMSSAHRICAPSSQPP